MFTKGKFTSGNKSMPRRVSETTPSTMKLTMTIVAKTGRLMEVSEIHMTEFSVYSSQFTEQLKVGSEVTVDSYFDCDCVCAMPRTLEPGANCFRASARTVS